jgi:hypothetical protein
MKRIPLLVISTLALASCGDRISQQEMREISRSLADVMVAVQRGSDSTSRARIADSVARRNGYDGWLDLRSAIADVAVEPDRLRTVLDSAQKSIERRAQ